MFANKLRGFFYGNKFLFITSGLIFFFSIYLRSTIDIGADTAVYLDLGKKVAEGKKYYYNFFESNFPISFYFYALQYEIAKFTNIDPIILSEIFINILALLSIFFAAKILHRTTIHENKVHYNLIIIAYFAAFFLRPYALQIGEFGTKTSLLLLLLFPYISYSFEKKNLWSKKDLIWRGILMGLMPCIKPHYIIFPLFIEFQRFRIHKKSLHFFLELDKLVMALVGSLVLCFMIYFTPQYFEFIPPMWGKTYHVYDDIKIFLKNSWHNLAIIAQFIFIFLLFAHKKFSANDKILTIFFCAAATLMLIENLGTIDQLVVFYAIATICFTKFSYDIFAKEKNIFFNNRFIILAIMLLPLFDLEVLPAAFLGLSGFVNLWWFAAFIYPVVQYENFYFRKYLLYYLCYFMLLAICIAGLKFMGGWAYVALNLLSVFCVLFTFELGRKTFCALSVFVISAAISTLFYSYFSSVVGIFTRESPYTFPNKFSDNLVYYSKKFAPKNDEGFLMNSIWIAHQFPTLNYLHKDNLQKFHIAAIQADKGTAGSYLMFPIKDEARVFVYSYLFDDVKNAIKNPKVKVVFFNNSPEILSKDDRCLIPTLEYYFLDPGFRKIFLENFRFENHVVITHKVRPLTKISLLTGEEPDIFSDKIKPSSNQILYDLEVYVRR